MVATGLASALAVLAAAPSKAPFYVAGVLLAGWAVVIAIVGIRRPGFPSSKGGRRGVILASLVLVLGAAGSAIATAGEDEEEGGEEEATSAEFRLIADPDGKIAYDRTEGTVTAGTVTIRLANASSIEHNVAVAQGARELGRSDTIQGADTELEVDLRPGEYEFYCTVEGHRDAGMEGTLTAR
jgi:plastocyanin